MWRFYLDHPKNIIMVSPDHFDVVYQINSHMNPSNKVDTSLALQQWGNLKESYESLGLQVDVIKGVQGLPDMVFAANQFVTYPGGIIYSKMRHPERAAEVEEFKKSFSSISSYQVTNYLEGMGDLLWDYEGERLFAGHGFRSELTSYQEIEKLLDDYQIITLKLVNDAFYHLDTCLSIINKNLALYVRSAFSESTVKILENSFENLIEVDEQEAQQYLACNAHCPDGKTVLVENNARKLINHLKSHDLMIIEIDTSEFLKSGGSIFCMKNQSFFKTS